jgi:tetratricopeptide (TPR) repeat protein
MKRSLETARNVIPILAIGRTFLAVALGVGMSTPARAERAAAAPNAIAPRAEATKLFRAKSYAIACPKFEELVKLVPDDADAIADLALCKLRVGDKAAARGLNLQAIEIASRSGHVDDAAAARTRRHAYFNLAQLDPVDPAPGGAHEQQCGELDRPPACAKSLFACDIVREDATPLALTALVRMWSTGGRKRKRIKKPTTGPASTARTTASARH